MEIAISDLMAEQQDMGDTAQHPVMGELPSSPRKHTPVELPKEAFQAGHLKEALPLDKTPAEVAPTEINISDLMAGVKQPKVAPKKPVDSKIGQFMEKYLGGIKELIDTPKDIKDAFSFAGESRPIDPSKIKEGAIGGAIAGAAAPKALELSGKVLSKFPSYAKPIGLALEAAGKLWGENKIIARTVTGALAGTTSSASGEVIRAAGGSDKLALTAELASGGLAGVAESVAKHTMLGAVNYRTYRMMNEAEKLGKEYLGKTPVLDASEKKVMSKNFGTKPEFISVENSRFSDATQKELKNSLDIVGVPHREGQLASDALRSKMYEDMTTLTKTGKAFIDSPEMRSLVGDVKGLLGRPGQMTPQEAKSLQMVLMNQKSSNPKIAEAANQDILNLIQNGGAYRTGITKDGSPEIKTLIPESAQKLLRARFNDYMERTTGQRTYDALKGFEAAETQSKAVDGINTMLRTGFKGVDKNDFMLAAKNISAHPEGKAEFAKVLGQHLSEVPPAKLKGEFTRMSEAIRTTGLMSPEKLDTLQRTISAIPKEISTEKRAALARRIITNALIGTAGQPVGQPINKVNQQVFPSTGE